MQETKAAAATTTTTTTTTTATATTTTTTPTIKLTELVSGTFNLQENLSQLTRVY
jgi:hypothetical protein